MITLTFLLFGLMAYFVWTMHQRLESLMSRHAVLLTKVRDGERVIIENFVIVEKRFKKLEHEIKEINRVEPKVKEANKAIARLQSGR